jgi:hypothetical protein
MKLLSETVYREVTWPEAMMFIAALAVFGFIFWCMAKD